MKNMKVVPSRAFVCCTNIMFLVSYYCSAIINPLIVDDTYICHKRSRSAVWITYVMKTFLYYDNIFPEFNDYIC